MGSSNTPVFFFLMLFSFFFLGHVPHTASFCSAKQILIASFATQARACILSDHIIFDTPRGGRTTAGSNGRGGFFVQYVTSMGQQRKNHDLQSYLAKKKLR